MKEMKLVNVLIGVLIGLCAGWWWGTRHVEKEIVEAYPEEVRPVIEMAAEQLGQMNKQETEELLENIRSYGKQVVRESDLSTLYMALIGSSILAKLNEGDVDGARKFCEVTIDNFRETFEYGMEIGDWQQLADTLYQRTSGDDSQDAPE